MNRFCSMRWLAGSLFLAASTLPLRAADVGDAVFPKDLDDKARAEIVYEYLQRDLDLSDAPSDMNATLEADVIYLRIHTDVGQNAYLDFDVGGIDVSGADWTWYGGVGLRLLAYDGPDWRVNGMVQIHYAPGIEGKKRGTEFDYDMFEVDGGIFLSRKIALEKDLILMPYVGPVFSVLDLDGDADTPGSSSSINAEQDNIFGAAAGLSLLLPGQNSFRFEARYFDEVSFSVAAGIAF